MADRRQCQLLLEGFAEEPSSLLSHGFFTTLLELGAQQGLPQGLSALHLAVLANEPAAVPLLALEGADFNARLGPPEALKTALKERGIAGLSSYLNFWGPCHEALELAGEGGTPLQVSTLLAPLATQAPRFFLLERQQRCSPAF